MAAEHKSVMMGREYTNIKYTAEYPGSFIIKSKTFLIICNRESTYFKKILVTPGIYLVDLDPNKRKQNNQKCF